MPLNSDDPGSLAPPTSIGPFRVLHQVGAGVLGPVFRAHSADTDAEVAVKLFRLDLTPEQGRDLASALGRLCLRLPDHPHIIAGRTSGVIGATAWLASAFVAADALDTRLRRRALVGLKHALPLLRQVASALDAAAAASIHHGALHPRDVLVTTTGRAYVTGFGVAEALIAIGLVPPSRRPYTAPERLLAPATAPDAAGDVFSLGALAVEMLTGRRASGTGASAVGFVSGVSEGIDADVCRRALGRALAESPDDRFSSAGAFVAALAHALTEEPASGDEGTSTGEDDECLPTVDVAEREAPADAPPGGADEGPRRGAVPRARRSPRQAAPPPPTPEAETPAAPSVEVSLTSDPTPTTGLESRVEPEPDAPPEEPVPRPRLDPPSAATAEQAMPVSDEVAHVPRPTPVGEPVEEEHRHDLDLFGLTAPEPLVAPQPIVGPGLGVRVSDDEGELRGPAAGGEPDPRPVEPDGLAEPADTAWQGDAEPGVARRHSRPAPVVVPQGEPPPVSARGEEPRPAAEIDRDDAWRAGMPPPLDGRLKRGEVFASEVSPRVGVAAGRGGGPAGWIGLVATLFAGIALGLLAGYGFWGTRPTATPAGAAPSTSTTVTSNVSPPPAAPPSVTTPEPPPLASPEAKGTASRLPTPPEPPARAPRRAEPSAKASGRASTPARAPARQEPTARPADRRPAATGAASLEVVSRPAGARVFLDGTLVGTTPLRGAQAVAGSHRVRLELAGYAPWTATVRVSAGERARIAASLEPSITPMTLPR